MKEACASRVGCYLSVYPHPHFQKFHLTCQLQLVGAQCAAVLDALSQQWEHLKLLDHYHHIKAS